MSDAGKGLPKVARGNSKVRPLRIPHLTAHSHALDGVQLLFGGVAAVTAGLGVFWYAQKASQHKKETNPNPGAIPTCAFSPNPVSLCTSH